MKDKYKQKFNLELTYSELEILEYIVTQYQADGYYWGNQEKHYKSVRNLRDKIKNEQLHGALPPPIG